MAAFREAIGVKGGLLAGRILTWGWALAELERWEESGGELQGARWRWMVRKAETYVNWGGGA